MSTTDKLDWSDPLIRATAANAIGLVFELIDGTRVRIALQRACAERVVDTLSEYVGQPE